MANFKGGFAFNNEAAKVEVEQAPDGTLVSCVNPVTGQSLNAGNYSEVITGTAAAPFGDYTISELIAGVVAGDISMMATFDASALGISYPIDAPIWAVASSTMLEAQGASFSGADLTGAYLAFWPANGTARWQMYGNGQYTDITAYMPNIPCVLTIYHHPMP